MSDDAPTQRLPQTGDEPTELTKERTKSRALLFTLIGVGAALLVALIVLLVLLLGQGGPTPGPTPTSSDTPTPAPTASDSPTPSATPTASESPSPTAAPPPPPPPPPSPIVSFAASSTDAGCSGDSGQQPLTFSWDTTGESVNFGIATDFADAQPYETDMEPVDSITVNYQCSNPTTKFSIAVFFNGDVIDRETITVQR